MRKTMCILLATALTTSMLSETPFLSRSVHSPMSYPTKKTIRFYKDADFPLLCDIGGETCGVFIVTVFCENSILFSDSALKK